MIWIAAAIVVCVLAVASVRQSRASALQQLRLDWGAPALRTRRLDAIVASHRSRVSTTGAPAMDDRTCADLNLDAVFAAIDRTESTLGQHALYHRLRSTPLGDHLEDFERLVTLMSSEPAARERAQMALTRLRDPHGYDLWWLARPDAVESPPWHAAFPILTAATLALLPLTWFSPSLVPLLVGLLAVNVAIRFATDHRVGATAAVFRQLAPVVATAESLQFLGGDGAGPLVAPLGQDVSPLRRLKNVARWVSGDPFMLSVSPHPLAGLATDLVNVVYEYLNFVLLLDATGVCLGAADLRANGFALLRVVAALGDVDSAISVASYRAGRDDWMRPHFVEPGSTARLTGIRHPLVDDAVPNSIVLQAGRGALITGSNMSGKSTFLRTVGVTTMLAQTIHTCLATEYEAPVVMIRSSIGRSDDLIAGKSYYIAEVEALLSLIAATAESLPHLFLVDELFRGTNAIERIAAGQAVLTELVTGGAVRRHMAVAATHDGELVDLLPETYDAYHFGDEVRPDGLFFDHRLRPGPATSRNAIALLRLHGAPARLVQSASACAETLDRLRGLARS